MAKVTVSFANLPDRQDFSLVPIGRYPARLNIDPYMKDSTGQLMTDERDEPVQKKSGKNNDGDIQWDATWTILDGPQKGKKILDFINLGRGLWRAQIFYHRAGLAEGKEDKIDLESDDLDNTYWWVEVSHPDPVRDNYAATSNYTFSREGCGCGTCLKYDGKNIAVRAKVEQKFNPMTPAEAVKYQAGAGTQNGASGLCGECNGNRHYHKQGYNGCTCENEIHPPF